MGSQNLTLQSTNGKSLPVSFWTALLALFAAIGIVLRQVAIPIFPPYVTLTPGFIMPLLTGIVLGPLGGIICGILVGISGALWEPFLIPLFGNIALGLSTGIPTYFRYKIPHFLWMIISILSATLIGGFLPTFIIEMLIYGVPPMIATLTASFDASQAGIWTTIALFIYVGIIHPLLAQYQRP
ncbi:MAG: hypothetical protein ACFFBU_05775 [Promethearchaeota archaeon]